MNVYVLGNCETLYIGIRRCALLLYYRQTRSRFIANTAVRKRLKHSR